MNVRSLSLTLLVTLSSAVTFAGDGKDAILGTGDTFACDTFERDAKVTCVPGVQSNYRGRVSFPDGPAKMLQAGEVLSCASLRGDFDVTCAGGGYGAYPPVAPVIPQITRKVYTYPDFECLKTVKSVREADDMVSNGIFRSSRAVDKCNSDRDREEVRQMERRGFSCTIDTYSSEESDSGCVEDLLSKIQLKHTIKGSHKRILKNEYCATQAYSCVK